MEKAVLVHSSYIPHIFTAYGNITMLYSLGRPGLAAVSKIIYTDCKRGLYSEHVVVVKEPFLVGNVIRTVFDHLQFASWYFFAHCNPLNA